MTEILPLRQEYGRMLLQLGREFPDIVVFDADVCKGTYTWLFAKEFPERFFNMGIAEQNMMVTAAGMATTGKIPFVNSYAVFAVMRACEQLRTFVAYPKLNVKIVGGHGGVSVGPDGVTHQGTEDVAIVRALPNMIVLAPADPVELEQVLRAAVRYVGPVYIRMTKMPIPRLFGDSYRFEIGKGNTVQDGSDLTLVSTGLMLCNTLEACRILEKEGASARIINMASIKPIDVEIIAKAAKETGAIVTVEDHNVIGGLGSAVAEVLVETIPVPMERIGLRDVFGESGSHEELFQYYGMTAKDIAEAAKRVFGRKS